jgi:hypothetical protein
MPGHRVSRTANPSARGFSRVRAVPSNRPDLGTLLGTKLRQTGLKQCNPAKLLRPPTCSEKRICDRASLGEPQKASS